MTLRFERGALIAVAGLVGGLIAAVLTSPLETTTAPPRASLRIAASQPVPATVVQPPAAIAGDSEAEILLGAAPEGADEPPLAGINTLTGVVAVSASQPGEAARRHRTTAALNEMFRRLGYEFDLVLAGETDVPRLFLAGLPGDLKDIREVALRKKLFFKALLPLVLQVNEEILRDRRRLWNLHVKQSLGRKFGPVDRLWLRVMAERYGVKQNVINTLLRRIDIIPPSLALAQAAEESGWGTSRFVREGNAVFGQWTFSESGNLIPLRRDDGKEHKIKAFPSLLHSVRAYARNLNTHPAYRNLRRVRYGLRLTGEPLEGLVLVENLENYSQRGGKYVETIRNLIETNNLHRLDDARLSNGLPTPRPLI